ncbi:MULTISPECIES: FAD-dependent oxidoreductase [Bacillaceae]|uniref:FAD-dependent oxidoreductase n=1 Tax=Evansella alkalicola TaxID=745819 RepID=A0ABS6JN12_9BACI|nr:MULTISPECIES: FAD-dependent oxidoreductase [Bacillaceae]MBU9719951.1 FAD-dependent oxidoreductase [Bacillus alkalicola]
MSNYYDELPQYPESYWLDSTNRPGFPKLDKNEKAEVVIVGGGITGITTGYLLAKEGVDVTILEGDRIFNGTTGHTTAKITAQHELIYDELIEHFGENFAKIYYDANTKALDFIRNTVKEHGIDCQFENKDAVLYGTEEKSVRKLEKEYEAYQKLGIPSELAGSVPFNVDAKRALIMKDQAQFHPLEYLAKLLDEFLAAGGKVYENTTAVSIMTESETGADELEVETSDGHFISCHKVLSCSHYPFYEAEGYYFMRMHAERSYIVAAKGNVEELPGMYLSVDKGEKRSVRTVKINGETHLLLGGEGHKTGQGEPTLTHYENLYEFGKDVFEITDVPYRWSAQDLYTQDNVPYIGPVSALHTNIFVATGYRKWGMTSSTAAAHILKDYVLGNDTPEMEIFSTERFHADPSLKHFFRENWDVAKHFVKGKLQFGQKDLDDIKPGEAAVVRIGGNRAGAYRDEDGELHLVDTTCTHMGCEVEWNNGERSWDCPCHGSRFTVDGDVMEGPAKKGLSKVDDGLS